MTKIKIKFFSLILSLILIMVSVPISISAKETSTEYITDETTQIQNNLISNEPTNELVEQESIVDVVATAATSTSEKITQIPEGIYAFENVHTDYYLSIENNSTVEGSYVVQTQYASSPIDSNNESAFFEITKHQSGETYIIRYKVNPNLTLKYDGERFVTEEISPNDREVDITQTFYITINRSGVIIQQYGQSNYIASQEVSGSASPDPYLIQGGINNYSRWIPHSYVTHIEDGVYALQNVSTQLWMSIENDSCVKNSYLQQHSYTQSPAADFTRGGLFKITQIGDTGRYTIRLMTNNLLTVRETNGSIKSYPIDPSDYSAPTTLIYDIIFDGTSFYIYNSAIEKFIAAPLRTSSFAEHEPNLTLTNQMEYNSRWNLYKYSGSTQFGVGIIASSELEDTGAIVGEAYTIKPVVWTTSPGFQNVRISLSTECNTNAIDFNWDYDYQKATVEIINPGYLSLSVDLVLESGAYVSVLCSEQLECNAIPKAGTYYIKNSKTEKYVTIEHPSYAEGIAVEQSEFSTANYFKWDVEHVEDSGGYVRLKSLYSGKYLAVDPNNSSNIKQYASPGDNGLWRFEVLDDYAVKIICKASESSGEVLAVPLLNLFDGANLTQREYTDNNNCTDEWRLYMFRDASFIALPETYDRSSFFEIALGYIENIGYTNNLNNHNFVSLGTTKDQLLGYMSCSKITLVRTHGNVDSITVSDGNLTIQDMIDLPDDFLEYTELVIYGACYTGQGGKFDNNLVAATVSAGARTVIGFEDPVWSGACNIWCKFFFEMYGLYYNDTSKTINDVCTTTDSLVQEETIYYEYTNDDGVYGTVKNYVIAGETTFP